MSPTLTNLVIQAGLEGKQAAFDQVMQAREQHWAGGAGKGGDVKQRSWLDAHGEGIIVNSLEAGVEPADLRRMASRLRARHPGDRGVLEFADYAEAAAAEAEERFTEYQEAQAMEGMAMTTEMMEALRWDGIPLREQARTPIGNQDSPVQHPRASRWMDYPTGVRPQTIDDREARGATEPAMSERLRGLAMEVRSMARLSSSARQRNRLLARSAELQRMALRQYQREMESEVTPAGDDVNDELRALANDANGSGDGDGDHQEFRSFGNWDNEDRQGSKDQVVNDVARQLDLDEDVPQGLPPRPGRRVDEDRFGDKADVADEPAGAKKNAYDDVMIHNRRGLRRGTGLPQGGDRYGRPGQRAGMRYSAFDGKESLRESGDLTGQILEDMRLHWAGSHSFF